MKKNLKKKLVVTIFCLFLGRSNAAEFEALGSAIAKVLGTKQAFRTVLKAKPKPIEIYYSKNRKGKAKKLAVVQTGLYDPDCTHTWVIGVNAKSTKVTDVRVVEMSCPHAFPTRKPAFLGQFKGKGKAQLNKISKEVEVVAKATGSSELTAKAVRNAVVAAIKLKGKI